jgi:S-DNA-T family DNA segregation ATPase FtsK/SpoIIIE
MAKSSRSRKRKKTASLAEQLWDALARPETVGLLLILISAFTLLSLLTGSRGQLTGAWIDLLQQLVGLGVWGVPLALGALGFWMVIYAIERMPNLPWQRPVGISSLLVAYITAASLLVPAELRSIAAARGEGGGLLGYNLAGGLTQTVGLGGAWAFVTFLIVSGVIFLTDRLLIDGVQDLWDWFQDWRERRRLATPQQPSFFDPADREPAGSPRLPLWQSLLDKINREAAGGAEASEAAAVPRAEPSAAPAAAPEQRAAPPQGETRRSPATQPISGQGDLLPAPRIIGGSKQQYNLPGLNKVLLDWDRVAENDNFLREQGRKIEETLSMFGVPVNFAGANQGPTVTQYLIRPGYEERTVRGEKKRLKVKVSKIMNLSNDLALALEARSVRIEAPVPGTSYVGVEVDNRQSNVVGLKDLMESEAFQQTRGDLRIALGEDVKGNAIVTDLARMPHLLIAGATGSGKSACINSIITCLLCTHTPESLRFLMVDPKMVELSVYNGVPHLLSPVVTEVENAAKVLYWAVKEMERRYQIFSKAGARDLERYNAHLQKRNESPLPSIVIVVDEMADLMMAAPEEVEKHICRLAQMARAVGIHLIIATQRPSVDVITGLIKANFPARIAFAVTSQTDSRVILDDPGAERLLGKGDMLYMPPDASKLLRLQGTYVRDDEVHNLVRYWKGFRSLEQRSASSFLSDEVTEPEADSPSDSPSTETSTSPPSAAKPPAPPRSAPSKPGSVSVSGQPMQRGRAWSGELEERASPPPSPELDQPSLFAQVEAMRADDARDNLFEEAVRAVQEAGRGSISLLQRQLRIGYVRASRLIDELEEAGILGPDRGGSQGRELLIPKADEPAAADEGSAASARRRDPDDDLQVWF